MEDEYEKVREEAVKEAQKEEEETLYVECVYD